MISLFNTTVTPSAIELATETLRSGFLSEGKMVKRFEKALGAYGLKNAVAVNSGTSALHLALLLAGVGKGDEVILPAQTFIATGLAVLYTGATPIFADIDYLDGGTISAKDVASKITERTRAIIGVDWAGYTANYKPLCHIVSKSGRPIQIIADSAHSFGATLDDGHLVGGWLDVIYCFSLQAIKHVTTGDGGVISNLSEAEAKRLRQMRWFGIDRDEDMPDELGERQYSLASQRDMGFKYHMNDLAASVGLGNLDGFWERLSRRHAIAERYNKELQLIRGLRTPVYSYTCKSSYWLYPLLVQNRLDFVRKLKSAGIMASVVHQGIHKHPIFGWTKELEGQARFDREQINIPVHDGLTDDEVDHIVKTIHSGW